jgi:hypothetical protein
MSEEAKVCDKKSKTGPMLYSREKAMVGVRVVVGERDDGVGAGKIGVLYVQRIQRGGG